MHLKRESIRRCALFGMAAGFSVMLGDMAFSWWRYGFTPKTGPLPDVCILCTYGPFAAFLGGIAGAAVGWVYIKLKGLVMGHPDPD